MVDSALLGELAQGGGVVLIAGLVIWRLETAIQQLTARIDRLLSFVERDATATASRLEALERRLDR